jgi:hypothetical protein
MAPWHRLRPWFALALVVVLIAVAALWLRGLLPSGGHSPLLIPSATGESPLATPPPTTAAASSPPAQAGIGAVLLWVALGVVLALAITLIILLRHRRTA